MVKLRWAAATDVGQVRSVNQDAVLAEHPLFAVADGMGGHAAGEVASAVALETLRSVAPAPASVEVLADAVRQANAAVYAQASGDANLRGMGTTLVALALYEPRPGEPHLALANVGDSRAYRLRHGQLTQLTRDHSYVADLVAAGQITEDEALHHPNRNMLTRALGVDRALQVDSWDLVPEPGDRYLLCSDGLFNEVMPDQLAELLDSVEDPDELVAELVLRANARGGRDNISVVLVDVLEGDDPDHPPPVGGWVEATPEERDGTPPGTTVVPTPTVPPEVPPEARAARPPRFTWRVAAFLGALVLLALVALGGALWYGRNTFYVTLDQDQVTIFKGRQGGFLWLDPTVEARFPVSGAQVPPAEWGRVTAGVEFSSREEAETYVRNLAERAAELGLIETERPTTTTAFTIPTTTSTTTTTAVPTTTVPTTTVPTTPAASPPGSATP